MWGPRRRASQPRSPAPPCSPSQEPAIVDLVQVLFLYEITFLTHRVAEVLVLREVEVQGESGASLGVRNHSNVGQMLQHGDVVLLNTLCIHRHKFINDRLNKANAGNYVRALESRQPEVRDALGGRVRCKTGIERNSISVVARHTLGLGLLLALLLIILFFVTEVRLLVSRLVLAADNLGALSMVRVQT